MSSRNLLIRMYIIELSYMYFEADSNGECYPEIFRNGRWCDSDLMHP